MSEQHTPGRLRVEKSTLIFANNAGGFCISQCPSPEANARRLVACWNALDGISTTAIEDAERSGSIAYRVITQRDELLSALKHIEGVAMADEWRDLPEIAKHARAVIAKVEGGAA